MSVNFVPLWIRSFRMEPGCSAYQGSAANTLTSLKSSGCVLTDLITISLSWRTLYIIFPSTFCWLTWILIHLLTSAFFSWNLPKLPCPLTLNDVYSLKVEEFHDNRRRNNYRFSHLYSGLWLGKGEGNYHKCIMNQIRIFCSRDRGIWGTLECCCFIQNKKRCSYARLNRKRTYSYLSLLNHIPGTRWP